AAKVGGRPAAVGFNPDERGGRSDARDRGGRGAGFAEDLSAAAAGGSAGGVAASGAPFGGKTGAFAGKGAFEAGFDGSGTGGGGGAGILKSSLECGASSPGFGSTLTGGDASCS